MLLLVPVACCVLWPSPGQEPVAPVAFVGATVLPMDGERRLPDHTLIVEHGRIAALGPRGEISVPAAARVIDASGKFLLPGLVDMHVHVWGAHEFPAFLEAGVTTIRNLFGSPMHLELAKRVESGALLGPAVYTAGPIVDGDPPVWPGSFKATTAEQGRLAVQQQAAAGYHLVKVYSRLPREAYDAVLEEARALRMPVDGHVPTAVGYDHAIASGQRVIEHLTGLGLVLASDEAPLEGTGWESDVKAWQWVDPERRTAWIRRTVERGTWLCPTNVVFRKMVDAEEFQRQLADPALRRVHSFTIEAWRNMHSKRSHESNLAARASLAGRAQFLAEFVAAGGRLLVGTDAGNPLVAAGSAVHEELALLVAAGLTPYQALAAATRAPAECLGGENEFGTLRPGLRADLLLLSGDPLLDVAQAQRPLGVMVRGRWLDAAALEALFAPQAK